MGMDIDEARRDDAVRGVMLHIGRSLRQVSDHSDAVALNADIGALPGGPSAVDDVAVSDDHVVFVRHGLSLTIIFDQGSI